MAKRELKVFNNQYIVRKKISSGSFGVVFLGEDNQSGQEVALKIEKEENEEARSLDREVHDFKDVVQAHFLSKLQGISGVPKLYWHGQEGAYSVLAIQLLGKDLAHYIKHLKRLSLKTVLMLGDQVLQTLEQVHNRGILHRDLKPENILTFFQNGYCQIYLVDFGISKFYRDDQGVHIQFKEGKPFIGTTRYASISAHKGHELGRGDDLESLVYVLIFLYKGTLPWQNLQNVSDKDKTNVVGQMKAKIDSNTLCKDLPQEFQRYLDYVKKMHFKSQPDYKYLRQLLQKAAQSNDIIFDNKYDWEDYERKINSTQQQSDYQIKQQEVQNISNNQASPIKQQDSQLVASKLNTKERKLSSRLSVEPGMYNFAQGDSFLKPPDPYAKGRALIQRTQNRHKSIASLTPSHQSSNRTFQSSLANFYKPTYGGTRSNNRQSSMINNSKKSDLDNPIFQKSNASFQFLGNDDQIYSDGTIVTISRPEESLSVKYYVLQKSQVRAQKYFKYKSCFKSKLKSSV